jgi:hypothetical protein
MTMCARTVTANRLPRGASLVLGCGAVAVGLGLTLRPFTSLDALVLFVAASLILAGLGDLLGRAAVPSAAAADRPCAPSALAAPFTAGAMFVSAEVLAHGWALVAPDYLGLGAAPPHPYLAVVPAARSALDAVRAARQVSAIHISAQTGVWGHSQAVSFNDDIRASARAIVRRIVGRCLRDPPIAARSAQRSTAVQRAADKWLPGRQARDSSEIHAPSNCPVSPATGASGACRASR